ncbi:Hypothetical predicted protein [Podarcis lilfordi]|uniref:Uncharacterized protein n=1 Tax=Podarcis lilfordi TaxID=74358 RepID=A0AA35KJ65_9SAUR|nr:Hypothetical predicted protein [Podarcis lilfordi]
MGFGVCGTAAGGVLHSRLKRYSDFNNKEAFMRSDSCLSNSQAEDHSSKF